MKREIRIIPLREIPLIKVGDDLPALFLAALDRLEEEVRVGDILVVSHSIVSVAEGRVFRIDAIEPSKRAIDIACKTNRDAAVVELALREATKVIREEPVLITQTKQGIITDYSGIDASNAPAGYLIALPIDPDASAMRMHKAISKILGFSLPVIIADTQGRPWRKGAVNFAIGIAGMSPFTDNAGRTDLFGRELRSSLVCTADEIASASELVMGQSDAAIPAVIVRGVSISTEPKETASRIIRGPDSSLFE
ncbi:MAG: coenzyme F420-0:L-glutamate ligase [Candidatus Hodarchaeota archaeon]